MTNVFNSLNSLIWLLVLILVIAAVVVVVRTVLTPRAGPPPSEPPVVHEQPVGMSGLAPGWYPDQNDPNSMRYFDGRVWTSSTQPRK